MVYLIIRVITQQQRVLMMRIKISKGVVIMAGLIPFNRKQNEVMNTGFEDFSNMIDDFFTGSWPLQRSLAADTFKIDIQDNDTEYTIEAELPGVKKEDVEITLNEGRLNISVKKKKFLKIKTKNIFIVKENMLRCHEAYCLQMQMKKVFRQN